MKNSFSEISNTHMKEYILIALLSLITILAPVKPFILLITLFVVADTIAAIVGNIKKYGIKAYKSTKLFNIVVKTFFYCSSIIAVFFIDKFIFGGSILGVGLLLTKVTSLCWIYIEIKSLDETSMKFFNNKSIWVHFKELFKKGKELKKDLNDIIEDDDKKETD